MIDFSSVKEITIPEGKVKRIIINGEKVWEKVENLFNGTFPNKTVNGLTFSWDNEKKVLTINGTATANLSTVSAYSSTDIYISPGSYRFTCKKVGGSYEYVSLYTWFRFGNPSGNPTKYAVYIDEPKNIVITEDVTAFAPRIESGSVFNNLQIEFTITAV